MGIYISLASALLPLSSCFSRYRITSSLAANAIPSVLIPPPFFCVFAGADVESRTAPPKSKYCLWHQQNIRQPEQWYSGF